MSAYTSTSHIGPPVGGFYVAGDTFTDADSNMFECGKTGSPGLWYKIPSDLASVNDAATIGAAAAVSGLSCSISRQGPFATLTFTLTAVSVPVTDDTTNGSYGTLKLFDFVQGAVSYLGCRQVYSAFTADETGVTAVANFDIGVGSTAIASAHDGALSGATEDDVGGEINVILGTTTLPVGNVTGSSAVIDGTTTAADVNLNVSGTAATVDDDGTLAVTGVIQVVVLMLGDD